MTEILFVALELPQNKGDAARAIGLTIAIRKFLPDVKIMKLSYYPEVDAKMFVEHGIKLAEVHKSRLSKMRPLRALLWGMFYRYLRLNVKFLVEDSVLKPYATADIIIDLSGDDFREVSGFMPFFFQTYPTLLGVLMGKQGALCSASIGPVKTKMGKISIKFILNRLKLITVREQISKDYLREIGISKPLIQHIPKVSLLVPSASPDKINSIISKEEIRKGSKILVGISANKKMKDVSGLKEVEDNYEDHDTVLARVVDYLVEELDATVVFIPHCISPWDDDRIVAEDICQLARNKQRVKSIVNEHYTPEELQGLIGQCDLFIGERLIACIAAVSMNVPVVAIVYNQRRYEIMRTLIGEHVCDATSVTYKEIISQIDDAWYNREKIKEELRLKIESLKESAWLHGKLIKDLVYSERLS